jgi:hypothetical protein
MVDMILCVKFVSDEIYFKTNTVLCHFLKNPFCVVRIVVCDILSGICIQHLENLKSIPYDLYFEVCEKRKTDMDVTCSRIKLGGEEDHGQPLSLQ